MLKRIQVKLFGSELQAFKAHHALFVNKTGLEIGGPSAVFTKKGILPVYPLAARVDGCNFSSSTVWEGKIEAGNTYQYQPGKKPGKQYISEGGDTANIPPGAYDFLLSSHSLEHLANPMKALEGWLRTLQPGGALLVVVPDRRYTFDHRRPVTPFEHLLDDYKNNTGENDLTHLDEILELHDLERDKAAGDKEAFKARSLKNFENRCLHHHVFDHELLKKMFAHFGVKTIMTASTEPFHTIILGVR